MKICGQCGWSDWLLCAFGQVVHHLGLDSYVTNGEFLAAFSVSQDCLKGKYYTVYDNAQDRPLRKLVFQVITLESHNIIHQVEGRNNKLDNPGF